MNSHALHLADAGHCANCHASVAANYCQQCGQETVLHPASAREFLHEFVGHYVALEGKLWKSLALLLFRPGRLTREYIEGRRVRYVQPLRVYLTFSIIFFALFKFGDIGIRRNDADDSSLRAAAVQRAAQPGQGAGRAAATPAADDDADDAEDAAGNAGAPAAKPKDRSVSVTDKSELTRWVGSVNPALGTKVSKFFDLPKEEMGRQLSKGFFSYAPYAMFLLMPVFAFWLKLLYAGSGRRYGEHLLFALHANAFAFAASTLMLLIPDVLFPLEMMLGLWLFAYLPMAMRRVYGGGRAATAARYLVLMMLHGVGLLLAIVAAAASAIVMT